MVVQILQIMYRGTTETFIDGGACNGSILSNPPCLYYLSTHLYIFPVYVNILLESKLHALGLAHHYLEGN
jgi:hypothetical protein